MKNNDPFFSFLVEKTPEFMFPKGMKDIFSPAGSENTMWLIFILSYSQAPHIRVFVDYKRATCSFPLNINVTVSPQTARNIVKLLISCHSWRPLLMAQECESSQRPGCKDQDLSPGISWTILSKAHSTVTFFFSHKSARGNLSVDSSER